jgi:hypothetical protein
LEEENPWKDIAEKLGLLRREKYKLGVIVTGGNHDFPASQAGGQGYLRAMAAFGAEGVGFAVDERICVQDDAGNFLRIFTSPMSCYRGNKSCAFQVHRACRSPKEKKWCEEHDRQNVLPMDSEVTKSFPTCNVDILMTHGPPFGFGDQRYDEHYEWDYHCCYGSHALQTLALEVMKPRYHVFADFHGCCDQAHGYGVSGPQVQQLTRIYIITHCCLPLPAFGS